MTLPSSITPIEAKMTAISEAYQAVCDMVSIYIVAVGRATELLEAAGMSHEGAVRAIFTSEGLEILNKKAQTLGAVSEVIK
jgi:hypothetical protein